MTEDSNRPAAQEVAAGHGGVVVVEDGANIAGRIVYWRLDGTMEHDVLTDVWAEEGLDEKLLPSEPGESRALRRVLNKLRAVRGRLLVRPLDKGIDGFGLIAEDAQGRDLDHATVLTAVITTTRDVAGIRQLDVEPGPSVHIIGLDPSAWQGSAQAEFQKLYAAECTEHDSGSVSQWLTWLMPRLQAVSLRDKGGIYFVPRDQLPTWDRIVRVLGQVSDHHIFHIPALRTQDAVDAIIDAVTEEAAKLADRVEADLALTGEYELGTMALKTRVRYCDKALAKLGRYEKLLDAKFDGIEERVATLKAATSEALLLAEAARDKEREQAQAAGGA